MQTLKLIQNTHFEEYLHEKAFAHSHQQMTIQLNKIWEEVKNHGLRVADLCSSFAKAAGWTSDEISIAQWAGYFHDLGKHSIPPEILLKETSLLSYEWEFIKAHPARGLTSYHALVAYPDPQIGSAILQHHENWDGSGYPFGLEGDQISPMAQIVSLADVVDALGSDRCYRQKWEEEQIKEFVFENRGKKWKEDVADLFLGK